MTKKNRKNGELERGVWLEKKKSSRANCGDVVQLLQGSVMGPVWSTGWIESERAVSKCKPSRTSTCLTLSHSHQGPSMIEIVRTVLLSVAAAPRCTWHSETATLKLCVFISMSDRPHTQRKLIFVPLSLSGRLQANYQCLPLKLPFIITHTAHGKLERSRFKIRTRSICHLQFAYGRAFRVMCVCN